MSRNSLFWVARSFAWVGFLWLTSCTLFSDSSDQKPMTLGVMTYNVENLFDTQHDRGKDDYTFLPMTEKKKAAHQKRCRKIKKKTWRDQCLELDWSEGILKAKMKNLSQVILSAHGGQGPDLLILQEVENLEVLTRFRDEYLARAHYGAPILIEGRDRRGIDVAILSRLPLLGKPSLFFIPFEKISKKTKDDTRGILEAKFLLPYGKNLIVFANHFPAPHHDWRYRYQAFQFLKKLKERHGKEALVIAAGDFNVTSEEDQKQAFLRQFVLPDWWIAHQSCTACKGTSYYPPKKSWSFLDMILTSPQLSPEIQSSETRWRVEPGSVVVWNTLEVQRTSEGFPARLNPQTLHGVSDHWPVFLRLQRYTPPASP